MSPSFGKKPIPFGKYLLLDRINIGGMAEVWRGKTVTDGGMERQVAIKRILPNIAEDHAFIGMFLDEARISVQLTHANVAQIYDLGERGGGYFIAMEYIAGKDLRAVFDRGRRMGEPAPLSLCCYVAAKVADGLDHAHRKTDASGQPMHIVHRDVSPQNVLLGFDGEVKVIDFGIAKVAGSMNHTQAGVLKGKFGYMSPEQGRGAPLDHRSDIFSLGICLYELLTGERLFVGESDMAILEKVRQADIKPPSHYEPKIPDALDAVVLKALAKDPQARYQYASELSDDLQRFLITSNISFTSADLSQFMQAGFAEDYEREKQRQAEYAAFSPAQQPQEPPSGYEETGTYAGMTDPSVSSTYRPEPPRSEAYSAPFGTADTSISQPKSLVVSGGAPELSEEVPTMMGAPLTDDPGSAAALGPLGVEPSSSLLVDRRFIWAGVASGLLLLAAAGFFAFRPRQGLLILELPKAAWGKSRVSIDGVDLGAPRSIYAEKQPAGQRSVAVTAPGFRPWVGTVVVVAGNAGTVLKVPLDPAAEKAPLTLELVPNTAEVRIGGVRVKQAGLKQSDVRAEAAVGQKTRVEVVAAGFRPFRTEVAPTNATPIHLVAHLDPATFAVTIRSEPPKATVSREGQELGLTPLSVQLPHGATELVVGKKCFGDTIVTLEPSSSSKDVQVRLQPKSGCRP